MKLVDNARNAWKWWSVRIAMFMAVLPPVWMELPDDIKAFIPPHWRPWIASGIAVAIIIARLIPQPKANPK